MLVRGWLDAPANVMQRGLCSFGPRIWVSAALAQVGSCLFVH